MLREFDRQGMMTSEYVYILPVYNVDYTSWMLTPWVDERGGATPRLETRHYEHVRMVLYVVHHVDILYVGADR